MTAAERVADVLGGKAVLKRPVRTWSDLEALINDGLPKRALQLVASRGLPDGAPASSLVYRVVPIATEALWEERDDARHFLNRPHPLLDDRPPLEVASTELGARRVEQLLHDVDAGLPL